MGYQDRTYWWEANIISWGYHTHFDKKFKIDLEKTKEFIKRNPQLLITRADKGNTAVIIKKSDYRKAFSREKIL